MVLLLAAIAFYLALAAVCQASYGREFFPSPPQVQDAWTGSAERAAVAVRGALTVELDRSNPPFRAGWAPYLRMVRR